MLLTRTLKHFFSSAKTATVHRWHWTLSKRMRTDVAENWSGLFTMTRRKTSHKRDTSSWFFYTCIYNRTEHSTSISFIISKDNCWISTTDFINESLIYGHTNPYDNHNGWHILAPWNHGNKTPIRKTDILMPNNIQVQEWQTISRPRKKTLENEPFYRTRPGNYCYSAWPYIA